MKNDNSKPYYEKTFERHKNDLKSVESGLRNDIRFDDYLGNLYVGVIERLHHFEGELAGEKIHLEDWQVKIIIIIFGWLKKRLDKDGNQIIKNGIPQWIRRFSTSFLYIPRKNGKSILASGVCIAEAELGKEIGNQIVSFATKREQAKIVYNGCKKMLNYTDLPIKFKEAYSTLELIDRDVTITTLSQDSKKQDGLSIGFGVGDEVHAFQDRNQIDVVQSSQGARIQPMMFYVTTAGTDTSSPGAIEYEYAKNVIDGVIEDDSYFAFICELDKDDDPFDEAVWHKANPNLGISKTYEYMRRQAKQAQERSEALNNFLVKDLNVQVNASEYFINFQEWEACGVDEFDVSQATDVLLGVDLSRSDDFTALAVTYILPNNRYYTTQHYYIPKDNVYQREAELRVPLTKWIYEGYITATPGKTIDYDYIQKDIIRLLDDGIVEICYDVAFATTLIKNIEKETGFDGCVQIRQGFLDISEPTYNFKDSIKNGTLIHDKNPVTRWMVSNMTVLTNVHGNIKPDKSKPNRKIDGCAAIINTFARTLMYEAEEENLYEHRELRGF